MNTTIRLAVAITALLLAGCTTEPGTPVPSDRPSTSTSASQTSPDNTDEAPRVKNPLDAKKFIEAPCSLLTSDQATNLGLEREGSQEKGINAPFCHWGTKERADYTIGFEPGNKKGLSDNYRAEKNGDWKYFEPTEVSDYPAAFLGIVDGRDDGFCGIVVGVRDELTFNVTSRGGPGRAACDKVEEIAGEVIATIKAGA